MSKDSARRFLFEGADIRGNLVHLEESLNTITYPHDYPAAINSLLAEFLVAALLLSDTIKFRGRLVLQANSDGPINLLMAEATHDGKTRGIARLAEDEASPSTSEPESLEKLLPGGLITVTVDPESGQSYQSIVPLTGDSLSACLEHYFAQSEQLSTFLRISTGSGKASGMMVQQLPAQLETDPANRANQWDTVRILAETITDRELLDEPGEVIIRHLFADANVKAMGETPVSFACSCSEERMAGALISLGGAELDELFSEKPELSLVCEFCGEDYQFDAARLTYWVTGSEPTH